MTKELYLTDTEWKSFKIKEIFKIFNTTPYHKKDLVTNHNNGVQYITRKSINNGLEDIVEYKKNTLNPKRTISFGAENTDFSIMINHIFVEIKCTIFPIKK